MPAGSLPLRRTAISAGSSFQNGVLNQASTFEIILARRRDLAKIGRKGATITGVHSQP
jgi:hypothetical protein